MLRPHLHRPKKSIRKIERFDRCNTQRFIILIMHTLHTEGTALYDRKRSPSRSHLEPCGHGSLRGLRNGLCELWLEQSKVRFVRIREMAIHSDAVPLDRLLWVGRNERVVHANWVPDERSWADREWSTRYARAPSVFDVTLSLHNVPELLVGDYDVSRHTRSKSARSWEADVPQRSAHRGRAR